MGVVGLGRLGEDGFELVAGLLVRAGVEQGDGVVVLLVGGFEAEGGFLDVALADGEVDAAALEDFGRGIAGELFEQDAGLLVFALLHELEGVLVILGICFSRSMRGGFGGRGAGERRAVDVSRASCIRAISDLPRRRSRGQESLPCNL